MYTRKVNHTVIPAAIALFVLAMQPVVAQEPDRAAPPKIGAVRPLNLPALQSLTLGNGIPVSVMEKHGAPLVELHLMFRCGIADDPDSKPGLASLTAAMMMEGAGTRSALDLADAIDFLGARISVDASHHTTTVSLFTPVSRLDDALALLADIALHPSFPSAELERVRAERLTAMKQWKDQPRTIASVYCNRRVYGDAHPYGRPGIGNPKALASMRVEDIRAFHAKYMNAAHLNIIVAGDVASTALLSRLETYFGKLSKGPGSASILPSVQQVKQRRIVIVDKPGAAQSEIRIVRVGPVRATPDYFALMVMNTLLGGSFSSRLNQNLREKNGYTYGARSSFAFRKGPGPFIAGAGVQTAVTDKALAEFMNELRAIREPASEEEILRAKNYVAYGYPQNFETVGGIADEMEELVEHGLPANYFSTFVPSILAVTADDVRRVATQYVDPDAIEIIIVGDRKEIEYGVRALKLGDVNVISVEDALGYE